MTHMNAPIGPSKDDVDQMKKIMSMMGSFDINSMDVPIDDDPVALAERMESHQVAPPPSGYSSGTTNADVNAMRKILESFYNSVGDEPAPQPEPVPPRIQQKQTKTPLMEQHTPTVSLWTIRKIVIESKNTKPTTGFQVYSREEQINHRFSVKEAAESVCKLMNNGYHTDSAKIQKIIDLDEEFSVLRLETAKLKRLYERSTQLNENQAADVFAQKHQVSKANALCVKSRIESIWEILE